MLNVCCDCMSAQVVTGMMVAVSSLLAFEVSTEIEQRKLGNR